MTKMKDKLLNRIISLHSQIEDIDKQISENISDKQVTDKSEVLKMGAFGLKAQELNIQLFTLIEVFLTDAEGTEDELPEDVYEYYSLINQLRSPESETDPEEIKKIKEFINSFKKNG